MYKQVPTPEFLLKPQISLWHLMADAVTSAARLESYLLGTLGICEQMCMMSMCAHVQIGGVVWCAKTSVGLCPKHAIVAIEGMRAKREPLEFLPAHRGVGCPHCIPMQIDLKSTKSYCHTNQLVLVVFDAGAFLPPSEA